MLAAGKDRPRLHSPSAMGGPRLRVIIHRFGRPSLIPAANRVRIEEVVFVCVDCVCQFLVIFVSEPRPPPSPPPTGVGSPGITSRAAFLPADELVPADAERSHQRRQMHFEML